jgi:hypothetical protein
MRNEESKAKLNAKKKSERGPSASLGMTRQKKKRRKKDGGREARRYIGKRKRAF